METRQHWREFDRDVVTIEAAMLYESMCMSVFALLLRLLEGRAARSAAAAVVAATLLLAEPMLYQSQSQPYGYIMASMCFLTALSMLHWALMEPIAARPSIAQAVMSPTVHSCHGIVKVHNKKQRQHHKHLDPQQQASKVRSLRALVVVDATGDHQQPRAQPRPAPISNWLAARGSIARRFLRSCGILGMICIQYDLGLYILCSLSGDMCIGTHLSSTVAQANAWQLVSFLQRPPVKLALFSCAASHLLLLVMDFMYCSSRTMMLAAALVWPSTAQEALDMPGRALVNPWAATSTTDLWGVRWVQFLRFYIDGMGFTAVDKLLPRGKGASPAIRGSVRTVVAFIMHGLMHEYMLWAAFGTLSGANLAFFGLHCVAALLESLVPAVCRRLLYPTRQGRHRSQEGTPTHAAAETSCDTPKARFNVLLAKPQSPVQKALEKSLPVLRIVLRHVWVLLVMIVLAPLLVQPYRAAGAFGHRAFHPMGAPITPQLTSWVKKYFL